MGLGFGLYQALPSLDFLTRGPFFAAVGLIVSTPFLAGGILIGHPWVGFVLGAAIGGFYGYFLWSASHA